MTLSLLELLSLLLVPLLLGWTILRLCGWPGGERLAALALAYLTGHLAVALVLAAWLMAGLPLESRFLVPTLLLLALVCRLYAGSPPARTAPRAARDERVLQVVLALLLCMQLADDMLAAEQPVAFGAGDESFNWALKAKLLFDQGSLGADYAQRLSAFKGIDADDAEDSTVFKGVNTDYPLLNPLLQVWAFSHAGQILQVENRFPIQLAMPALLCLLAATLRRRVRPTVAAALLLAVGRASEGLRLAPAAGSDVLVALGLLASVECLLRWREEGLPVWLRLAALSLAFTVWSKNEGWLYAMVLLPVLGFGARLANRTLLWFLLPFGLVAATHAFNAHFGFDNVELDLRLDQLGGRLSGARIAEAARYLGRIVFLEWDWHAGLFAVLACTCVLAPRAAWSASAGRLALLAWLLVGGVLGVYLLAPHDLNWNLCFSSRRVLWQQLGVVALWLACVLARTPALRAPAQAGREPQ
ncbi:MAG: hypothetical protein EXS08_08115 [Planctomycetes bacterium]|nr:hypothetical protein [Planctomycetota bacterium]